MNKKDFLALIEENMLILDGATGTELQKRGMPLGVCPEMWVIENPQVIVDIQREYIKAGSKAVYTCTFGGNRIKLSEFGLESKTIKINEKLAQLSRQAVGEDGLVAGDLAPTGQFIRPFGSMQFEEAVDIYKEQVQGLLSGGVDFFVIETMLDIQEARAALIAVKESCELPVCVSMTFDEGGRTLTGTDPVTALIILESLGADAVGCNCSTGPRDMLEIIRAMKPYAGIPLMVKPNAGLPRLVDGKTQFDMGAEEFGGYAKDFVDAGVNILGGCCGTSPLYIKYIQENIADIRPKKPEPTGMGALTSAHKTVFIDPKEPVLVIGERINPSGKKSLQEELRQGGTSKIREFARQQLEKGANILDVNVGMPGIDEKVTMVKVVEELASIIDAPLCIDSSSPEVIEAALRVYPGRALVNSISAEKIKLEKLLPIASKYGAMFILLPLDDEGVPKTAQERFKVIERVFKVASRFGYTKNDFVVDGLVMTVSAEQRAAAETLGVVEWCSNVFGCATVLGLSNVSFGMPERKWVNSAFLAMAIGLGLTMAILNPSGDTLMSIKMASDVLKVKDKNSKRYIEYFAGAANREISDKKKDEDVSAAKKVFTAVVKGEQENVLQYIDTALKDGITPQDIVDIHLIPAITYVGELYDKKQYFLPQLIQSAETMKTAFKILEPLLEEDSNAAKNKKKVRVVLATVKGDIHDIGKNIVGLMLKNYGFEVYDLGKDIDAEEIISKAKQVKASIIGLSALMTTTMVEMKGVVELAKKEGVNAKIIIGGAVVDAEYAKEIGADGYSEDAYSAVKLASSLSGIEFN